MYLIVVFFFSDCTFGVMSLDSSPGPRCQRFFFPVFSSKSFIVYVLQDKHIFTLTGFDKALVLVTGSC